MKKITLLLFGLLLLKVSFSQTTLTLNALPLQTAINEGATVTYTFDQTIDAVASRNPGVISWQLSGNTVAFKGLKAGRTGLKITAGSKSYYMGLRVNTSTGAIPGMPPYVSIGSVSEDVTADLQFWKDIQPGAKNKSMDIRYIYINGGPINGWHSWGAQRPGQFSRESLRHGLIPFFVYYNIPDAGESFELDLKHIQDPAYMTAYFNDLNMFLDSVENVMKGELYGIILEPDFLGYMQQNAKPNDPLTIKTAVSATSIAANAGNLVTLIERINKTIQAKRNSGSNLFYGWQQNLWSTPDFQGARGIIRNSDENTLDAAKYLIKYSASEATMYQMKAGVLTHGADFISIDKYGLDAMGTNASSDPAAVTWFWNNDHWKNYLLYSKTIHEISGKPVILWQLPVGRINQSSFVSAYTGAPYADVPNTPTKYEDSSTNFFLGDSINTTDALRTSYFNQNKWQDSKVVQIGNMIRWGRHIQECKDAGIICVQFGAGVNASTDGVGNPPSDNYFWIQKVQDYYQNGTVPLEHAYPETPVNPCIGGCPPVIKFINPVDASVIYRSNLDSAKINFSVWDNDGSIASLTATIDGNINLPTNVNAIVQQLLWAPPTSFGQHTLKVTATDNNGLTTTQTITFSILKMDPVACGFPEWDANTTYGTVNTKVTYNGLIFKNKYWTKGDMPYMGGSSSPWILEGLCPGTDVNTGVQTPEAEEPFLVYPNPTSGTIYFTINAGSSGELTIADVKGAVLYKEKISAGGNEIDLHQFSQGIYFMRVQLNDKVYYQKLIRH